MMAHERELMHHPIAKLRAENKQQSGVLEVF
jgi:hypothetical protein